MPFLQQLESHLRPGSSPRSSSSSYSYSTATTPISTLWSPSSLSDPSRRFSLPAWLPRPRQHAWLQRRVRVFRRWTLPLPGLVAVPLVAALVVALVLWRQRNAAMARAMGSMSDLSVMTGRPRPEKIRGISTRHDAVFQTGCADPVAAAAARPRANGAFVVLARNKELKGVVQSIRSIERHFNRWFHYPYVFLNDGDFNSTFKQTVANYTSGTVEFGKLDPSMWGYPEWVDKDLAREGIRQQGDKAIMYGEMESYHHMCRFYSGFFYKHPLLDKYKWYWRLEPDIKYFCDITYDPFVEMETNNKTYGFTIAIKELKETVPNIFRYATAFKRSRNVTSTGLWKMFLDKEQDKKDKEELEKQARKKKAEPKLPEEILDAKPGKGVLEDVDPYAMEGEKYNMCHFWSNFEIANLDWFRSREYNDFFDAMDRSGGFWMERWGDAPIHSLAAGLLLDTPDLHYFRDFGYRHTTIQHCPANAPGLQLPPLPFAAEEAAPTAAERKKAVADDAFWKRPDAPRDNGVGCRCRCDTDLIEVEGKEGGCLVEWVNMAGGWT